MAVFICAMTLPVAFPVNVLAAAANTSSGSMADVLQLQETIEGQQQRIDTQDVQLKEQERTLQELRNEVDTIKKTTKLPDAASETGKGKAKVSSSAKISYKTRGANHPDEWLGFYKVPGTETHYRFGGFAELDILHDTHAITTPSAFETSAIVTRNATDAEGANGQTNFSVQASRLTFETRSPLQGVDGQQRVVTFISFDFFNDFNSTTPEFRLRQAYAEVSNLFDSGGDFFLGQDWSTVTNLYAAPNTLDFQGPNAAYGVLNPLVRWTQHFKNGIDLKLALESPEVHTYEGNVSSVSQWPDAVIGLVWEDKKYNVMITYIARDLNASANSGNEPMASAFGWGTSVQGRVNMPKILKDDYLVFSLTFGAGIGGLMNDAPPDAVYNAVTNELEPLDTTGLVLGYQRQWSSKYYSAISYGYLEQENLDIQPVTAFKQTTYSSINFVWTPNPIWLMGIEMLYGTREDKDGTKGTDLRTQITSRFEF